MARQFLAGVADVDILAGTQLIATAKTLLNSSITIGSSAEDVRGGTGAKLYGKYFHTSTFDVKLEDVMFKLEYFAFQTGSTIQQIADIFTTEQVTLATGGAGSVVGTPVAYQNNGIIGWAAPVGTDTYTTVTFTGKNFTVTGAAEGAVYCVKYISSSTAARQITISSSFIPSEVTLVMRANLYNGGQGANLTSSSSKIGEMQVLVPRFLFNGSQEVSMTSTGAATSPINGSALDNPSADCSEGGYYAIITENITGSNWYDNVNILAIEDSDVAITGTGSQTLAVYAIPNNGAAFQPPYADLTFTSGATAKATVSNAGVVTGVAAGSTTVTVAITAKNAVSAVANVTVS